MREIVSDVWCWSRLSERHGYDFNGHLIRHPGGNLCIDPVAPDEADLAQLAAFGATRILITNRNHTRAANRLRERLGARTAIAPLDRAHAESQGAVIDDELTVGSRVGPLEVVAAAGKSPGEVVLCWPERRTLIIGDAVIGNPPGRCNLLPESVVDDPQQLRQSVAALMALDFDTMLMGDGISILSDAKARLGELIAGFPA